MSDAVFTYRTACLRFALAGGDAPVAPPGLDWAAFFEQAWRARLLGPLALADRRGAGLFPPEGGAALRSRRLSMLLEGERRAAEARDLLQGFAQAGVRAVLLKGWAIIFRDYAGQAALRPCGDIDLLIDPHQVGAVEELLAARRYRPLTELRPGQRLRHDNRACHYFNPEQPGSLQIDLHWGLFNLPYHERRIDLPAVMARALPLDCGGVQALRLAPEEEALHACGHIALHHEKAPDLYRAYELAWAVRAAGEAFDWARFWQTAAEWRVRPAVHAAFDQVDVAFPGVLPADVRSPLGSPDAEEMRAFAAIRRWGGTPLGRFVPFDANPAAWLNAGSFLLEAFFPSKEFLLWRYGPSRFWPAHLLRRFGNTAAQLLAYLKQKTPRG